jgi:hypothetical protein
MAGWTMSVRYVDEHVSELLQSASQSAEMEARTILGVNHEQQHQELILTDLKHAWAANPMQPVYREPIPECGEPPSCSWLSFAEGLAWIGRDGEGFSFDNERSFTVAEQALCRNNNALRVGIPGTMSVSPCLPLARLAKVPHGVDFATHPAACGSAHS